MDPYQAKSGTNCLRHQIPAHLDGDLPSSVEAEFELHLRACPSCLEELNQQKKLVSALDLALDEDESIELPRDFTKTVVANAESSVGGLRLPQERFRAVFVCAGLFLLVILGLGEETPAVVSAFGQFSEKLLAVGGLAAHLVHDFAVGFAVVSRTLFHRFIIGPAFSPLALLVFVPAAAYFVSRIIFRQYRA